MILTDPCVAPSPDYSLLGNHYYKAVTDPSSYTDAKADCEAENSHLFLVYDPATDWDTLNSLSGIKSLFHI